MRVSMSRASSPPLVSMSSASSSPLADLYDRGVLRRYDSDAMRLPGEVGSGYKSGANLAHLEPEEIYILGTSHISATSATDVERALDALRPDAVVIELCRSRTGLLYADEVPTDDRASNSFGLSGEGGPLRVLRRSLELGGWVPLLLRVLLVRLSDSLSAKNASPPGADYRAARRGANLLNATLVLGDRPVEITLERAWRALSWQERGNLAYRAFSSSSGGGGGTTTTMTEDVVERALGSEGRASATDALEEMEQALAATYPSLLAPLLTERDIYLSLTMKSSLAVSGKKRVLGVVGRGHLDGVCKALGEDHSGGFKALTTTPSRLAAKQRILGIPKPLATRLTIDAALLVAAWVCWQQGASAAATAPATAEEALVRVIVGGPPVAGLAWPGRGPDLAFAMADLQAPRMGDFSGSLLDVLYNNFALEGGFLLLIFLSLVAAALGSPRKE